MSTYTLIAWAKADAPTDDGHVLLVDTSSAEATAMIIYHTGGACERDYDSPCAFTRFTLEREDAS